MKIINKLTWRHLWVNRRRTVITLFGIIISVAMVTAVFTSVGSLMRSLSDITAAYDGAWHAQYMNLQDKDVQTLSKQKNVKTIGLLADIGQMDCNTKEDSGRNETSIIAGNQNLFAINKMKPVAGRLPNNTRELMVTKSYLQRNKLNWKVGDTVTVQTASYPTGAQEAEATGGEPIVENRTFTVCGILEVQNQLTGMNSAFCGMDDTVAGGYTAQVQFSHLGSNTPKDIKAAAKAVYGKAVNNEWSDLYTIHADYLMYNGVQMSDEVTQALYGFVAIILLIIILASVFMIYDSFAVSYQQRARYLGMLASVGATRTQKRGSVYFEGFILGCIGIPIGILCGIGGIAVTLRALSDSFMKTVMVATGDSIRLRAVVDWKIIVFSVLISALTIFISAWIPAHRASKITPIEALRQTNTVKVKKAKKLKTSRLRQKLFGFEDVLAVKNYKRNAKRSRTVVFALAVSVILFLTTTNFTSMLTTMVDSEYDGMQFDVYESVYSSDGPLSVDLVEKLNKEVSRMPGIESIRICADNQMLVDGLDKQLTAEAKKANMARYMNVLGVDNDTFAALAKEAGIDPSVCQDDKIPTGILINRVQVATVEKQSLVLNPLQGSLAGQTLTGSMEGYDSEGNELYAKYTAKVAAQMNKEASNLGSFMRPTLVVPMHSYLVHFPSVLAERNIVSYARYYITAQDHDRVYTEVSDLLNDTEGISHNGYDATAQAETMRALRIVVMTFGYGFITLITLISVMNIINTVSSGMEERRREFAMIKSVGMTPRSFKKSIYLENIRYGVMALVWGLPVSLGLDFLMYKILGGSFDYGYTFRWYYYLAAALAVFAVIGVALLYALDKIKKDNIIETLKRDDI
ncbi:MAG: FtsX-like permease family protein [Clostridium sp.]|nr:FtsX-like permease family protein [Clostridium sp.]